MVRQMAVGCPILTKVEAVGSSGLMQPVHADDPLLLGAGVGSCAVVIVAQHTKNDKRNSTIQCIILSQLREDKRIWVAWAIRAISLLALCLLLVGAFAAVPCCVLWRAPCVRCWVGQVVPSVREPHPSLPFNG